MLLPLAKFAYKNAPNKTTSVSPFFAHKGYHPNLEVHPERDLASARARDFTVDLGELHEALKDNIRAARPRYQKHADNQRILPPEFKIGDKAYVKAEYFHSTRPSRKLSEKNFGPYEIIAQPSSQSYTLRLPDTFCSIHPVFHISFLELAHTSSILNQTIDPPPPVEIKGEVEYEIAEILDTKLDWCRRCKLLYRVQWTRYEGTNKETSWITANELAHAQELVANFHTAYPDKPGPSPN